MDDPSYRFLVSTRFCIQRILVPIVVLIGVGGNIISVIVLTRRRMRSSTNVYLTALAIADLIYLLFVLILSFQHYPNINDTRYELFWRFYGISHWLCDAASSTSVWLTVSFTIERYVAVCHPIRGKVFCTERRAKTIIWIVSLLCFLFTATTPFEYELSVKEICVQNSFSNKDSFTESTPSDNFIGKENANVNDTLDYSFNITSYPNSTALCKDQTNISSALDLLNEIVGNDIQDFLTENDRSNETIQSLNQIYNDEFIANQTNYTRDFIQDLNDNNHSFANISHKNSSPSLRSLPPQSKQSNGSVNGTKGVYSFNVCNVSDANLTLDGIKYATNSTELSNQTWCVTKKVIETQSTNFGNNKTYKTVYYWFSSVVFGLLPLVLIATFNCFLVNAVYKSRKRRKVMTNSQEQMSQSQENRITLLLIGVVVLFLVCQTPTASFLIYDAFDDTKDPYARNIKKGLGNIFNFLCTLNASCNFILYCVLSDKFRRTFRAIFCSRGLSRQDTLVTLTGSRTSQRFHSQRNLIKRGTSDYTRTPRNIETQSLNSIPRTKSLLQRQLGKAKTCDLNV